MVMAVESVQKPPMAIPSSTRASRITVRSAANATISADAISNNENTSMTMRRSMRRVTLPVTRLVNSATSAVMVTVCPAWPSDTPRL